MKIPVKILNDFDKASEGIEWGELAIKAVFQGKGPVFFLERNTARKYPATDASVTAKEKGSEETV